MNRPLLHQLVHNLTADRKVGRKKVWHGSGYIGIDWTPVNLGALRALKRYVESGPFGPKPYRLLTPSEKVLRKYPGAWSCCGYRCAKAGWVIHPRGDKEDLSKLPIIGRGPTSGAAWEDAAKRLRKRR